MDLQLPGLHGIDATREIVAARPGTAVLVLTMFEDDDMVFSAVSAGAAGYLLKGADGADIVTAIRAAGAGQAVFGAALAQRLRTWFTRAPQPHAAPFPQLTRASGRSSTGRRRPDERSDRAADVPVRQDRGQQRVQHPRQAPASRARPGHRRRPRRRDSAGDPMGYQKGRNARVSPTATGGRLCQALTLSGAAAIGFGDPGLATAKAAESRRLALQLRDAGALVEASRAQALAAHSRGDLRSRSHLRHQDRRFIADCRPAPCWHLARPDPDPARPGQTEQPARNVSGTSAWHLGARPATFRSGKPQEEPSWPPI